MAVKATNQLDIVDLTDGYSIFMSSESAALVGNTSTANAATITTTIYAYRGTEQVACSVTVANITYTGSHGNGISASKDSNSTQPTLTFTVTAGKVTGNCEAVIPVEITDMGVTVNKQFSFTVSKTGSTGAGAYNYIMGVDAITIPCDKDGATLAASTITVPFSGWQGTSRKAATATISGLPTGITAPSGSNTAATASADGSFALSIAAASALGGDSSGQITVTFNVNSAATFTAKISWSKSITGATGATGGTGAAGTNATNVICGNDSATIPCTLAGVTAAAQTITIPFSGWVGNSRAACSVQVSGNPSGISVGTNTAATTSADGTLTLSVASGSNLGNASTLSGEITLTFSCNSKSFVKKFTWAKAMKGATGEQGEKGDDAITLVIESSAGTIFKNTSAATTLTARVFKGGVEVTGSSLTALGTIKWYKDGGSTAVGTGATLSITSGTVTNHATYVANLEG
jgi:hypothetical protein